MKKVNGILASLLFLFSHVTYARIKVGVLDVQRIILSVEEGKQARQKLEKKVTEKEVEFKKQHEVLKKMEEELQNPDTLFTDELKKMGKELSNPASLLSEEARMKKNKEFEQKKYEARVKKAKEFDQKRYESMRAEDQFKQQIKSEEMQATQKIAITASKISNEILKKEDFDLIFEAGSSGLISARDPIDITEKVIQVYKPQDLEAPRAASAPGKK